METKTQIRTAQSTHVAHTRKRIEAATPTVAKRSVISPRHEKLVKAQTSVKKVSASPESTSAAETPAHPRPRRTTSVQPVRKTIRPITVEKDKVVRTQPVQTPHPVPAVAPKTVQQTKPITETHPATAHSQMARIPRKVKAHQANLEDAAAQKENRMVPSRPSRRRYSPINPNQPPEAGL